MMTKMMEAMIGRMSIETKQKMMMNMMPMMMQDVNMAETMVKMMPVMLDNMSVLDVLKVLKGAFPKFLEGVSTLSELRKKLKDSLPQLIEKMPKLMETMMPVMSVMVPMVMGKLMPLMMTEENMEAKAQFMEQMMPKMLENEELQKIMPEMMMKVMPHCLVSMSPYIVEEKRDEFFSKLQSCMINSTPN